MMGLLGTAVHAFEMMSPRATFHPAWLDLHLRYETAGKAISNHDFDKR
jgi:hypothetical protein